MSLPIKFTEWIGLAMVLACVIGPAPALGAGNQATGDVAGDVNALEDSNLFILNSTGTQLAVVKRAFLPDGTVVPDTSILASGSVVKFLVYLNNVSSVPIQDVSVQDTLDPLFSYQLDSIQVDNSVGECAAQICDTAEELVVFNSVKLAAALLDIVDTDVGSYSAGVQRIDVGNDVLGNARLDLAPDAVWAMLITVTIQ